MYACDDMPGFCDMPNDLLNSTICLESLICVAQVPMMEQIMRSLLFLVPGEWGSHSILGNGFRACLLGLLVRSLSHCFSGSYWLSGYGNKGCMAGNCMIAWQLTDDALAP